ncbi:hypothetical protein GCM10008934_02660 [Virgibacillus salarius]|uniref:hypothetical protein n=1 Tax=Virgibacillus salarius TaxID=447199 RepID=UPI0031CE95E8
MNYCKCGCGKEIGKKSIWAKGHNPNKAKNRFDWSSLEVDYQELGTLELVARKYGCSLQAVYHQLKKRGIDTSLSITDWSNVLKDYEELKSVNKIAKKYNCSTRTVIDKLSALKEFKFSHDNKPLDLEVGIGRYGERIALGLFEGSKDMNEITTHYPYDIDWKGLKIDVKTSNRRFRPNGKIQYSFTAKNQNCSHYLLIALDDNNFPIEFLLVPKEEIKGVTVSFTFGSESKWDKYKLEVDESELRKIVQHAKRVR